MAFKPRNNRSTSVARAASAAIEGLESRRMLTITLTTAKVLTVTGTAAGETISVTYKSSNLRTYVVAGTENFSYQASKINQIFIIGAAGNDTIKLSAQPKQVSVVNIDSGAGDDTVTGSNKNETITLGDGNDSCNSLAGDDTIFGGAGNDTINGGDGNVDRIYPGLGNDSVTGGAGNYDTVSYQDRKDGVTARIDGLGSSGNLGSGELDSISTDFENVVGSKGRDRLYGNTGANVVGGDAGDDTLTGGLGNDTIWGDQGTDTVDYSERTLALTINLAGQNVGTGSNGVAGEKDVFFTLENVVGGAGNDTITGDAQANRLTGNGGKDSILGGLGNDFLFGNDGNDTLFGQGGVDNVDGGAGTDKSDGDSTDVLTSVP